MGEAAIGSTSTPASAIALRLQGRTAREPLRASRVMATCCASTSSIPKPSAPMPAALHARSRPIGLLGRRHVAIDSINYIGKESNRLEEVEEQSLLDPSDVYTEYPDPRRDEWATQTLPQLRTVPVREACEGTGISRAQMRRYRNKGARPRAEHLKAIKRFLRSRS